MYRSKLSVALSASLFALPAFAQDEAVTQLNTIVIQPVDSTNASYEVEVTGEDLVRIDPTDLQDLFAAEPTIQVGSSIPASQKLYVNGVEETNLAVSIDGNRQNNKIFHHSTTNLIDPQLLTAVVVEPGVAPADVGPGALAGAIQFETKDALDLLKPGQNFGGFVETQFETNGNIFTNNLSLYGRRNGFDGIAFVQYAVGEDRHDGNGNIIIGSATNFLSGLGKIAYQSESGDRFEISYEGVTDDEARPYRANIGRIIGGRPVPLTRDYDLTRHNAVFTYTDETPEGQWDPTFRIGYAGTKLDIVEPDQLIYGVTDSINGKLQNRFTVPMGTIAAGVDFYADRADTDYRYLPDARWNESGSEAVVNVGSFAQARLDLTDDWRVSFGGRVDYQRFEGVDNSSIQDAGVSGNVSTEYDITSFLAVTAGYSHVWAGYPLAENFIINPSWTYANGILPTTSNNYYAGFRAAFEGALTGLYVEGKVFRTDIDDARTPEYSGGPDVNKDLTTYGFEVATGYNWGSGFARVAFADIVSRIDGNAADSYTGQYLTTPIGSILTVEAAHTFTEFGLTIGGNAEVVFQETDTYDSVGGKGEPLPGYEVFNAFVQYEPVPLPNLRLCAEVSNIFDKAYASRATYGQEFASVEPLLEPGRSFKLSARVSF